MKYLLLTAAIFLAGCALSFSTVTGSGNIVTKQMTLGQFDRVDASGNFQVDITQGTTSSVTVSADDNVWDSVQVRNDAGILHLGTKSGSYSNTHISAKIVMPRLTALTLSGATVGSIQGFDDAAGRLDLTVSGASTLNGGLHQQHLMLNVSGASGATLHGAADHIDLTVSGASHGDLDSLVSDVVRADISGASNADVTARQKLDYNVSGASHLSYAGSPTIGQAEVSGASSADSRR